MRAARNRPGQASPRLRLLVVASWAAFLLVTTSWIPWDRAVSDLLASDMAAYEVIARASPSRPSEPLQRQHAERFPVHYGVGLLSQATGLELRRLYRALSLAVVAAILAAFATLLAPLPLGTAGFAVAIGGLVASPYALRFFLVAPGMLGDAVFVLATALFLYGLLRGRPGLTIAAAAAAVLARQTGVMLWPAAVVAVLVLPAWRGERRLVRAATVAGAVFLPLLLYVLLRVTAAPYATGAGESITVLSSLGDLPGSSGALAAHAARTGLGIAPLLALLAGGVAAWGRMSGESVVALTLAAAIAAQPLLLHPEWVGGNAPRLSALGVVPLAAAAAVLLTVLPSLSSPRATVLVSALAAASLHHVYAVLGPRTAAEFAVLALASTVAVVGALALGRPFPRRGRAATASPPGDEVEAPPG